MWTSSQESYELIQSMYQIAWRWTGMTLREVQSRGILPELKLVPLRLRATASCNVDTDTVTVTVFVLPN